MEQEVFSREDLTVMVGNCGCVLSASLICQQGLSREEVEYVKHLHKLRLEVEEQMRIAPTKHILRGFNSCWTDLQFLLQDAWKFPRDSTRHRFWEVPRCSCPRMDNEDSYPNRYYTISCNCEVHGDIV